jgi:hypothetical protein
VHPTAQSKRKESIVFKERDHQVLVAHTYNPSYLGG